MIKIHAANTDGYPFDPNVKKSFYSTIARMIAGTFTKEHPSEKIVVFHYMVLKEIYSNGFEYRGVNADHRFLLPIRGLESPITSQCLFVEYASGEVRAIDFTDRGDGLLSITSSEIFTGAMVSQYDKDMLEERAQRVNHNRERAQLVDPRKLYPGFYGLRGYYTPQSDTVQQFSKHVTKANERLYFRGLKTHPMRTCLEYLSKYPDAAIYSERLEADAYFEHFGAHKIALGLPGGGDVCFRDFEAFALKIPLLRPQYKVTLAEPLLPDFHYAKVDLQDNDDPKILAEAIIDRYRQIVRDGDFLQFITTNAYEYYIKFGTYENITKKCFNFLQPSWANKNLPHEPGEYNGA